jgi:hypothetical protein
VCSTAHQPTLAVSRSTAQGPKELLTIAANGDPTYSKGSEKGCASAIVVWSWSGRCPGRSVSVLEDVVRSGHYEDAVSCSGRVTRRGSRPDCSVTMLKKRKVETLRELNWEASTSGTMPGIATGGREMGWDVLSWRMLVGIMWAPPSCRCHPLLPVVVVLLSASAHILTSGITECPEMTALAADTGMHPIYLLHVLESV